MRRMAIHRPSVFVLILAAVTLTVPAFSQDVQKLDPAVGHLVAANAKLERVATGFDKWTEGPVWTRQGSLLFAEIPANNIDQWIPGKGASVFIHPSGYEGPESFKGPEAGSNGMTLDAEDESASRAMPDAMSGAWSRSIPRHKSRCWPIRIRARS